MTREEAIKIISQMIKDEEGFLSDNTVEAHKMAIIALKQEPKIGHWIWQTEDIYRCSECGNDIRVKEVMNIPQYVRCPMCEAKMVEPQKSEDKE